MRCVAPLSVVISGESRYDMTRWRNGGLSCAVAERRCRHAMKMSVDVMHARIESTEDVSAQSTISDVYIFN